ncbi:DUF4419 domain-containing protein [Mucilaginibacter sp. CAU 1740]|uniref:DUF4419 domain-containing protein n=1 Tax=Mucilaginibacter sp. CAU 1740 TaxID=3140365 RepID=UPI00325B9B84
MRSIYITTFLLFNILYGYAQKSITFKVEDLKSPETTLKVESYSVILENLIRQDNGVSTFPTNRSHAEPAFNIIAKSKIEDSLVTRGYHPFFEGMFAAYADHRPFTLSPDMIWLLISQGFANHVNNNSEELRKLFVKYDGKTSLIVVNNKIKLDDPESPWEEVFPEFSKQIAAHTGKELTDALTADFTTTTPVTRVASQATLMNAVKSYFEFIVMRIGCGIPQITLEGTPQDWERVLAKTEALRKYKLDWWVDGIEPPLKQFIQASKGKVDKDFWKAMFKYHSEGKCGAPTIIDGWIVKFFPYDKDGKRMGLKEIAGAGSLPNEIVKVDLEYQLGDGAGNFGKTPLELWAGFVGLKQNNKTFGLRPEIGWMIRKKDTTAVSPLLVDQLKQQNNGYTWGGIILRSKNVPPELFHIGPIKQLEIFFTNGVHIPNQMADIKVEQFKIHGDIDAAETERIQKLMPGTKLIINNQEVSTAPKGQ